MEAKKEEINLTRETTKQTFISLAAEVFFTIISGEIVSNLTGGIALIVGGSVIYYVNSELTIGKIIGVAFPIIGLLMVVSEIRDIVKKVNEEQKVKS